MNEIIAYLLLQLSSKSWKDRESACRAIESMLNLYSWPSMSFAIDKLWDGGFSMLDDVRDSCRVAAMGTMKSLVDCILRVCDQSVSSAFNSAQCLEIIEFLVPKLLSQGLISSSMEGKGFSLGVLAKLIKLCRYLLRTWLPRIISILVECMSAFEPGNLLCIIYFLF